MSARLGWLFLFVALYATYCIFWGVDSARSRRGALDYFLAGRGLPSWVFAASATAISFTGWMVIGESRGPCPEGQGCTSNAECRSGVCRAGLCLAPACDDGVLNGDEVHLDCGGSCPGCPPDSECTSDDDCSSRLCVDGACTTPTCTDGVHNGAETGVDCGACGLCDDGEGCAGASDCRSQVCTGGSARCRPARRRPKRRGDRRRLRRGLRGLRRWAGCARRPTACRSSARGASVGAGLRRPVRNGDETDSDCGGFACPDCADGAGCAGEPRHPCRAASAGRTGRARCPSCVDERGTATRPTSTAAGPARTVRGPARAARGCRLRERSFARDGDVPRADLL